MQGVAAGFERAGRRGSQPPVQAQADEQMLRHHVVGKLVDVAHDVQQRQRRRLQPQWRGLARQRAAAAQHGQLGGGGFAHTAGQQAAELPPRALDGARRVSGRLGVGAGPDALAAAAGVTAGELHALRVVDAGAQIGAPVAAARRLHQRHALVDVHAGQGRLCAHQRPALRRVGREGHDQRLEIDQQRIGLRVVRPQWLTVKGCGTGR